MLIIFILGDSVQSVQTVLVSNNDHEQVQPCNSTGSDLLLDTRRLIDGSNDIQGSTRSVSPNIMITAAGGLSLSSTTTLTDQGIHHIYLL